MGTVFFERVTYKKYSDRMDEMLKYLIFDVDNTLIRYNEDFYPESYKLAFKKRGMDDSKASSIFFIINEYESLLSEENPCYNKEEMLAYINKSLNENYDMSLIDLLLGVFSRDWTRKEDIMIKKETLDYLYSKYDLYIYSNYFADAIEERIKNLGFSDYFKGVFGADIYGTKEYESSYKRILEERGWKAEECVMIGDSKKRDILPPVNLGMKAILVDDDGLRDNPAIYVKDYKKINDVNDLTKLL